MVYNSRVFWTHVQMFHKKKFFFWFFKNSNGISNCLHPNYIFPWKTYILSVQNAQAFAANIIFRILADFNVTRKWGFTARIVLYSHKNVNILLTIKSAKIRKIKLETKGWAFYKGKI